MKNEDERKWADVPEDELGEIASTSPDRHVRRMARGEMKSRKRTASIQSRTVTSGEVQRLEIVGVHLTAWNLLTLAFKSLPAVILIATTIWWVVLIMNLLMLNVFVKGMNQEMESWTNSLEQVEREFRSQRLK